MLSLCSPFHKRNSTGNDICHSTGQEIGALPSEKLVNIQIPLTLKKQLIDDCEFIMHLGKVITSINSIIWKIIVISCITKMYIPTVSNTIV